MNLKKAELEKLILKEIFNLPNKQSQLDNYMELRPELFNGVRTVFESYGKILGRGNKIDHVLLTNEVGEAANDLMEYEPYRELSTHICLLKELHYKNELVALIESYQKQIKSGSHFDDIDALKNEFIADLSGLELDFGSEFINFKEHTHRLDLNLMSNKKIEGWSYGLANLDTLTSGILAPTLIVIGGLKKGGKTRFLMHIRKVLYEQNIHSIFLSLEVPAYQLIKLTYSTFCGINEAKFRSQSFMSNKEKDEYNRMKTNLNINLMPTECMSTITLEQTISRIRRYSKIYPKGVIFIDYLQRIEHDENKQAQQLERIAKQIANATRAYNVSIILLSQLNNQAEHRSPSAGDLRGSGSIGEAADTIILFDNIYRRTKKDCDRGKIELTLEQRYNDSGKITIYADLGICRFAELPESKFEEMI